MNFAIIAAGEGSRIAGEGSEFPKPLVRIGGKPMIGRLLEIMQGCGAGRITVAVNPANVLTVQYLGSLREEFGLEIVEMSTPSSMHTLYELSGLFKGGPFCVTTVDTVFRREDFRRYIEAFSDSDADAMMGVTGYVDDEKPLYVGVGNDMVINGFFDTPCDCRFVSGGIYGLTERCLDSLERCIASGQSRMRSFQRQLIADGLKVKAFDFGKVVDVDHLSDVDAANSLVAEDIPEKNN
ncbi:MAG: NTP transferase domain-containing protein [Bacteroidaceae bacterium]|nr:NTP transferase domain-containing protein [Bacteroidaceae bacterium]